MSDQVKFRKMLEILMLLSGNVRYSKGDLARRFSISERTVYRYIDTFKEAGLVFECCDQYVKIDRCQSEFKDISELLHFSEEEAYILSSAIHAIDNNNLIKTNLVKKLYSLYDFDRVAQTVVKQEDSENVHQLMQAIKQRKQVKLINYQSASSGSIGDRLVEPFDFLSNYIAIWCYEPVSGRNKQFKITRIGRVEIAEQTWLHQPMHQPGFVDVFRVSSHDRIPVKLLMSLRAKNLLEEEYPLASKSIVRREDGRYLFDDFVCSFHGVARFIMGLCDEITVVEPDELKLFVKEKIKKVEW